jgi:hypothetical protein
MDSRKTTQGDGDERTTENVVRLPRDWLGPREELVPMGSRAHAAESPDDASTDSLPPTAASFWDEDSGSLQAPMQAPADAWQGRREPACAASAAPATSARHWMVPRPRLPRFLSGGFASRRRRGTAAAAGLLSACVLVILAVIGQTEGSTHNARQNTASFSKKAPIVTATGVNRARLRAKTSVMTEIKTKPSSHHAARWPARKHRTRASNRIRHHARPAPQSTPAASQPARSTTPTYTPIPTSAPSTGSPSSGSTASSPPAATARSTNSSSQHQPAFGPSGSLGPGSSPDS